MIMDILEQDTITPIDKQTIIELLQKRGVLDLLKSNKYFYQKVYNTIYSKHGLQGYEDQPL